MGENGEGAWGGRRLFRSGRGEKVGERVGLEGLGGYGADEVIKGYWVCDLGLNVRIGSEWIWRG